MIKKIEFSPENKEIFDKYAILSTERGAYRDFLYIYCSAIGSGVFLLEIDRQALFYVFNYRGKMYPVTVGVMPDADYGRIIAALDEFVGGKLSLLCYRDEMERFKPCLPKNGKIEEARDEFEYVYRYEDLAFLKDRKYHAKRNHIRQFENAYPDFSYERCGVDKFQEYHDFLVNWENRHPEKTRMLRQEKAAAAFSLKYLGSPEYKAAAVRVGGKLVAFTAGTVMDGDTALIMFEKCDADYKGIYAFVNNRFLTDEFPGMTWVNRDQDIGIEGLRKAKMSYYPARFIEAYEITTGENRWTQDKSL